MNIPKQLLNLLGAVLVLAIVAAGTLLVAVPVWTDSTAIAAEADRVVQSNLAYETQIRSLRESESELSAIQASVIDLRRGIPSEPRMDEIFEVAAEAAAATGLTIVSATAGDAVAWAPRAALTPGTVTTDEAAPAGETESTEALPPADGAPSTGAAEQADAAAPASPQTQVDFTIVLKAPDPAAAERFIDALADGDRLISVVHSGLTATTEGYDLTVNAFAFVRTET